MLLLNCFLLGDFKFEQLVLVYPKRSKKKSCWRQHEIINVNPLSRAIVDRKSRKLILWFAKHREGWKSFFVLPFESVELGKSKFISISNAISCSFIRIIRWNVNTRKFSCSCGFPNWRGISCLISSLCHIKVVTLCDLFQLPSAPTAPPLPRDIRFWFQIL